MSRYTDIDLLLNNYQTICSGVACMDCPFNDEGCRLEKMLLESPTVDAVPVVHGHWEREIIKDNCGCNHCYYCCSKCGKASDDEFDYCQNCGAKMDALDKDINVHCKTDEVTE